MKLLIKGGLVIDPSQNIHQQLDLLLVDGKVFELGYGLTAAGAEVIDAGGLLVVPGLIDAHVHLREPGFEAKETIASGTAAAAMGGFTGVACMPNTNPVADNRAVIRYIVETAAREGLVNVYPVGASPKGSLGEELAEIADLAEAGAVALSDDGRPVMNAEVMRRALEYAQMFNLPIISHCEDKNLAGDGVMNEGYWSTILGLRGIPAAAEEVMVARDLILAAAAGARLHIAHASTAGSVRLIREAKSRGVKVTAEAAPHHLALTDAAVQDYDTATKVNPPLRSDQDVESLRQGLREEVIDLIATDHAPHTVEDKDVEYDLASFGIVGLETAVPWLMTELVVKDIITMSGLIAAMTVKPARLLGLPTKGSLQPGMDADLAVIDPGLELIVDPQRFASRGRNTPLAGRKLRGWPLLTIVGGRLVMRDRQLV